MCDVSSRHTLLQTKEWKQNLNLLLKTPETSDFPILLLVNKCDLVEAGGSSGKKLKDPISEEEVRSFVEEEGFFGYIFTSAKTGKNIKEAFVQLVKEVQRRSDESVLKRPKKDLDSIWDSSFNKKEKKLPEASEVRSESVQLHASQLAFEEKKGCCK